MSQIIKAQVIRRAHPSERCRKPWVARAISYDPETAIRGVTYMRTTKSAYAHSFPEALQLAQVARQAMHDALMDEVHASRTARHDAKNARLKAEPTA